MKVKLLLPLLFFSIFTFAQDDYCSCMETDNSFEKQNSYEDLFTSLSQYKEEFSSWQSQTIITTRKKIVIPPKETVTLTLVEKEFQKEQELELELESELELELEIKINSPTDEAVFEQVVIKRERTEREKSISGKGRLVSAKVKTKKKRLKGKVKRKKRVRKYKGACPNF